MIRKWLFSIIILSLFFSIAACKKAITITVSFNSNGGSEVQSIEYTAGKEISLPNNPTRDGYTFAGWFFDQNQFSEPILEVSWINREIKEDITVYAKWDIKRFAIIYQLNGGVNDQANPVSFTIEDTLSFTNPTKEGSVFAGWYVNQELTEVLNTTQIPLSPLTLYAKWEALTYTITWKDHDGTVLETDMVFHGSIPAFNGETPSRQNSETTQYTFMGWTPFISQASEDQVYVATYQAETIIVKPPYDPTDLNAIFGFNIYQSIPSFSTLDVILVDLSDMDFLEVYIDIFDWTEADLDAYLTRLDALLTWDDLEESWVLGDYYIYLYADDETYPDQLVYGIGIYGDRPSHEEPDTSFDPTELNKLFGYNIYQTMPAFDSKDALVLDFSENGYIEVYIDIFDWTEADADLYIDLLDQSYTWDALEESWVLGKYFIYVYEDDETYPGQMVYGIGIYGLVDDEDEEPSFDADALNAIFGYDIYQTMPNFVSDQAILVNMSEDGYMEVYIDILDWTELDVDQYMDLLDSMLAYDSKEDAWVLGNYYIYVFEDDETYPGQMVYGIGIYGIESEVVEPVDGLYYSFNIQQTTTSLTSSYRENVNKTLNFSGSQGKVIVKASYIADIDGSAPQGLSNGIILAADVKDTPQALAFIEIDTLGQMIQTITFEIEARDNFSARLTGAKLQVYNGTAWVDHPNGNFYSQLSTDRKTITITGVESSKFRLIFIGTGATSNGGQVMVSTIQLYQGQESTLYTNWTDMMVELKKQMSTSGLDAYLLELEGLTQIELEKVGQKTYAISGTLTNQNNVQHIQNYINETLNQGYILSQSLTELYKQNVYTIIVNDDLAYAFTVFLDDEQAMIIFFQYDPVVDKVELNNLTQRQSINQYEVQAFGKSGLPSTGTYDVLVVPIEISGFPFPSNYESKLNLVFNGTSAETGWESVQSFYRKSSYGLLNLTFVISSKHTTTQAKTYYENYKDEGDQYAIKEALLALDSTIDFSKYDSNQDGVIDSIIFIYSVDYNYDQDPWWAWVYAAKHGEAANTKLDGKSFEYYMWASYYFLDDDLPGSNPQANAETYIHELGHLMGLLDYYSFTLDYGPLGGFDMMDYNAGDHGPASKLLLGWLKPMVAVNGTYEVTLEAFALDQDGMGSALVIPYRSTDFDDGNAFDEFIVIMFYTPQGLYDAHVAADYVLNQAGLIIYHVDARLYQGALFWEGYFMYDNDGESDFFISILEADKNNSLPGKKTFLLSDMLTSGLLDLSSYSWHQGGSIDVSIEFMSSVTTASENVSFVVSVN